MDAQRASGAPIKITIGNEERFFSRLSQRAVRELIADMPAGSEGERRWYNVFDLARWSATPEGSVKVLAKAAGVEDQAASAWGSEVSRSTAAGVIVAESCLTGEEPDPPKKSKPEGEHRPDFPETLRKRPDLSLNTRRAWAILGRLLPPYGTRRSLESANS